MKDVSKVETLPIPAGVTVQVKARKVTVEGPRGTLHKDVRHVAMDIQVVSRWRVGQAGRDEMLEQVDKEAGVRMVLEAALAARRECSLSDEARQGGKFCFTCGHRTSSRLRAPLCSLTDQFSPF